MAKFPTFPNIIDNCYTITITKLKEWDYILQNIIKSGVITWSKHDIKQASISITVKNNIDFAYMELQYSYNDKPIRYKVKIISIPSNIGKGLIWYFVCPQTGKKCRKLYLVNGYFLHRTAFTGCMYESQTETKQYRGFSKKFCSDFICDNLYSQLYKKHFKKSYKGKPTKRYLKLIRKIEIETNKSDISQYLFFKR